MPTLEVDETVERFRVKQAEREKSREQMRALIPVGLHHYWRWEEYVEQFIREPQGRKRVWRARVRGLTLTISSGSVWGDADQTWRWDMPTVPLAIDYAEKWIYWRRSPSTWRQGIPEPDPPK